MNCMKCGREASDGQVFCGDCLERMQAHPVKPGTPVLLPSKTPASQERHPRPQVREPSMAEQLRQLHGVVRWLTAIIAILSVLLCATAVMLLRTLESPSDPLPSNIGKNYTSTGVENLP